MARRFVADAIALRVVVTLLFFEKVQSCEELFCEKFVSLRIPQKETPEISAALKKDNLSL